MKSETSAPLVWPNWIERTLEPMPGHVRLRLSSVLKDVIAALHELGLVTGEYASNIILSCEKGALFRKHPEQGAAVWFVWADDTRCVPCDLYSELADNFATIAQLIKAFTAEHERGSLAAIHRALADYTPPLETVVPVATGWRHILGVSQNATQREIQTAFRRRALLAHPDRGGDRRAWDILIAAYKESQQSAAIIAQGTIFDDQFFAAQNLEQESDDLDWMGSTMRDSNNTSDAPDESSSA